MVSNIVDAMKGTSGSKVSQAQKSKKTSSKDKSDFGQALTDAAGAANSANSQAERQNYDQKEASAAEKGPEGVAAVQESPNQQVMLAPEGMEGQDHALMGLVQGAESSQTAEGAEALWGQNMAEAVKGADAVSAADVRGKQTEALDHLTGSGAVKDLPQEAVAEAEMTVNPEELAARMNIPENQADAKGQQTTADSGGKASGVEPVKEETNVVDVRAEAAADKAGMSYIQQQGSSDSGVVEAQVEVTGTGEIKPEYTNMLKDIIAKQLSSGRQELEISLTPKNLGTLLVKVAVEAGETTVSIICTNAKAMQAMSSKAAELGRMLEGTLGDKMDVVVEDKNNQESHFYDEGRNDTGAQAQKEEQERRHEESRRRMEQESGSVDFLQQLRLGLA